MKLCSECKEPLNGIQAFTEEGQEDFPWCFRCLDYVDGEEARSPPLASAPALTEGSNAQRITGLAFHWG